MKTLVFREYSKEDLISLQKAYFNRKASRGRMVDRVQHNEVARSLSRLSSNQVGTRLFNMGIGTHYTVRQDFIE